MIDFFKSDKFILPIVYIVIGGIIHSVISFVIKNISTYLFLLSVYPLLFFFYEVKYVFHAKSFWSAHNKLSFLINCKAKATPIRSY